MTDLIAEACTKAHDHGFEKGSALGVQVSMAWLDANGQGFLAAALEAASLAGELEQFRSLPQPAPFEPQPSITHHPMLTDISPTDIDPVPALKMTRAQAQSSGYTGDVCGNEQCQQMTVKRNGSCTVCDTCGQTTGCS